MEKWNRPSDVMPEEGEHVAVRLPGGKVLPEVLYSDGVFWKVRTGNGGQGHTVEAWKRREEPKKQEKAVVADGAS